MVDNAFSGVEPSGAPQNAFQEVPPESTPEIGKPPVGPSGAQTAALATLDPRAPDPIEDFRKATASYGDAANAYGEASIRLGIGAQQRAETVNRAVSLLGQPSVDMTPQLEQNKALQDYAAQEAQKSAEQRAEYAQEQKAVENIQEMAGHGDTVQAKLLLDNMIHGGPVNVQADIATKQMLIRREVEKAQVPYENQGWVANFMDAAAGLIPRIPGVTDTDVWSFNDDHVVKNVFDGLWSGTRQENEIGSLWSLPVDQFQKALSNVVPAITSNSSFMGLVNHGDVLDMLTRLQQTPSATEQNTMDTIDNLGWIPYGKIGKLASLPSYMIGLGARKEASTLLSKAAEDIIANGVAGSEKTTGLKLPEVEQGLSPSALNIQDMDMDDLSYFNARMEDIYSGKTPVPEGRPEVGEPAQVPDTTVPKRPVPIAVPAVQALQTAERLLATVGLEGSGRLTPVELAAAEDAYKKSISEQINGKWVEIGHMPDSSPIQDVQFNSLKLTNGSTIRQPIITLGGFATKEEAFNFVDSLGYTDAKIWAEEKAFTEAPVETITGKTANGFPFTSTPQPPVGTGFPDWSKERGEFIRTHPVVQDASGQYMAQITRNLPENGFYTNVLNPQADSAIARKVLNARLLGDKELADQAALSGNMQSHFLKNVIKPYTDTINKLGKQSKWFLGQVLAKGESASKWWSEDEFKQLYTRAINRLPSDAELQAYSQYRNLNDIEHSLRNDAEYMIRSTRGMETVSFDTGLGNVSRENAIVHRIPVSKPTARSYAVGMNEHFNARRPLSNEQFDALNQAGHYLIETERPIELNDGTSVKWFHVKPQDATIENLRRDQVNYLEGGHRMYTGKYMVKQAVYGVQKDTGQKFLDSPTNHVILSNMAEAKSWASRMEAARTLYNDGRLGDIDRVFNGHAGFPTSQEFIKGVEYGVYQKDTEFTPLYDREMPSDYYKLNTDIVDYSNKDESGISSWLRSQGRMYYGQKGPQAKDYHGALAPTLDPYETLNASLMNIARLSSFTDYKQAAVQRWVESFKAYTDYDKLSNVNSPWQVFEKAEVSRDTWKNNPKLANGIQAQKDIIKTVLGWQTPTDIAKDHYGRNLAEWIVGDNPDNQMRQFLAKPVQWWSTQQPLNAIRGWAFDLHLGFFNPASFALHASTAAAIVATGKDSLGTMMAIPFMRIYLTKSGGEDFLNHLVQTGISKGMGFTDDNEFKTFMRYSKNSGFLDLNNTHQLINSYGPRAALSDYGNAVDKVRQAGRFFFNEGVLMTRMAAQKIAWQETRENFPKLAIDSTEFKTKLAGRAEDYSLSMSRESQSHWQSGLLSVPTQFWAYPARIFEAMFGNTFTGATRTRLIMSQLFMGGAAALPFTSTLMAFYENSTGAGQQVVPPDSITGMVDRGLLDTILYKLTGADVTVGHRFTAGKDADEIVGGLIPGQVKSLFGFSGYGTKSFAEVLGGVGGSMAGQMGQTAYSILKYATQESGGETERPVTGDDIKNLALNIGSINNAFKAYMIQKYGQMVNKKGTVTAENIPSAAAWETMLLGGTPAAQDHVARMMDWLSDQKQAVKDAAGVFTSLREKAFRQPDRSEDFVNQANQFSQMLPDNIRSKALRMSTEQISPSLEESLQRQIDRERIQSQMIQSMQESK